MKKNKFYYKDGTTASEYNQSKVLHREDGPAIEYTNGQKEWYVNGKCHRIGGPAKEYADGGRFWYVDGKRHRVDGPAIEWSNGDKPWWVDDELYTEENFNKLIEEVKQLPLALRLIDTREWVRNFKQ